MENSLEEKIFGHRENPFLIWAPRWIQSSAGIRAGHYLCHSLNSAGHRAFLVFTEPRHANSPRVNGELNTPVATSDSLEAFLEAGLKPIAFYPEDVIGNPLNAPVVIRMLWNYSGALGGPSVFDKSEIIWAFSENIARDYENKTGYKPEVLFVPPVDPREFPRSEKKKNFQVVYAGKYRSFIGKPFKVGALPSVEIFRDGPKKQNRDEVKQLIAEASVVYSFENSSIVTEAILSGTPAVFVPNKFLGEVIAEHELGWGGCALGDDPEALAQARSTISLGINSYHIATQRFFERLEIFAQTAQAAAVRAPYVGEVKLPDIGSAITKNRLLLSIEIIRTKGLRVFGREVIRFFSRRL